MEPPSAGAQNTRGVIFLRFLVEIAVYLGNGTASGCYGTLIGNHSGGSIHVGSDDLE